MKRKRLWLLLILLVLLGAIYVFRYAILSGLGHFLIVEQPVTKADAIVVLSGNAFDRGNEGARLYQHIPVREIICPGGNLEPLFLIQNDSVYESDMCKKNIIRNGIDSNRITVLHYGTSTAEEADTVLRYCKQKKYSTIIVVSSKFHTRRAGNVYTEKAKPYHISVITRGANSFTFDEEKWWQSEEGMIALNNEYVKLLYYLLK